jgi:hypothetical protein
MPDAHPDHADPRRRQFGGYRVELARGAVHEFEAVTCGKGI